MNIHDRSSLLLVPSGYKDGKLYSQVPNSGDGDFTFTRGSNLAATRVGANGLIEKGRENLNVYSNNLFNLSGNGYGSNQLTISTAQPDPFGGNEAVLTTPTAINSYHRWYKLNATIASVLTASVYVKPNGYTDLYFSSNDSNQNATYSLTGSGVVANKSANTIDAKIEALADGWYRITHTINASSVDWWGIYIGTNAAAYVADGVSGVYFYGLQIEVGLVATDYIESGATTGKAGILENQPRLDYSGGASRASLLLEPSRTNLIEYSEYFDGFSKSGPPTLTLEDVNSPEGVENVYSIVKRSAVDVSDRVQQSLGGLATNHIFSIFLKLKSTTDTFNVRLANNQGERVEAVVSTDGTMVVGGATTSTNYDIENYGNGWYRLWMETTTNALSNFYQLYPNITNTSVGECYFYGAQVEEGSYPTSYIPTYGTSATRSEDATSELALSPSYGSSNTWFFELKRIIDTSLLNQPISIIKNDSTGASNRFTIMSTSNGRLRVLLSDENGTTENLYSPDNSFDKGETIKAAVKITPSGCTLFVDGASAATSSSVGTITGIDAITYFKNAALNQFLVFPTALSDTDCELLTGTTYESFAAMAEALNYTVYE